MSELRKKPLTKLCLGEMVRNNQKTGFYAVFLFILGLFGHLHMDLKRYSRSASGWDAWPDV
jgi:hypothetical protein